MEPEQPRPTPDPPAPRSSPGPTPKPPGPLLAASGIALAYAVFAALWILLSDRALGWVLADPELLVEWSIVKGLAFVAVTAVLLWALIHRALRTITTAYHALAQQTLALRAHEGEIERLSRLYAALSAINQTIVRAPSREDLLQRVCDTLVAAGFRLAWIGWHDEASERILPAAATGDDGYLATLELFADERPAGQGPLGRAFRQGEPYVCNDLLADAATAPWRAELARHQLRSAAAFPIREAGRVRGLLIVYADDVGHFREREVGLLGEAAGDVSFALQVFANEAERRSNAEAARRERAFSDTLVESTPGILYLYDEQRRFLRWNRNFEEVSGYRGEEIALMQPLDFFAREDRPLLAERIQEVFTAGRASVEAPFLTKSGTAIPYLFTGRMVEFAGRPCLVGMGIDISERHRAELARRASEERFRTTLANILEGCQLIDFEWRYLFLNEAAAQHNRRPNEELLGRTMLEAWPGIEATEVFALLERTMRERVALHQETEFRFADGSSGWFDIRCQPAPEGILVLSIDISERRQAELALRELNEQLELRVAERTVELAAAVERAEAADRIKSAFLATMSHELRTPLNSIIGFTGILLQGLAGPLNPEQSKQLGMVRRSARHLLELINDVLDLSKIEAGQLEVRRETFALAESIERVVAAVQPLAEAKGLALGVDLPPTLGNLTSDRRRVEQILLNLLNNAIKFTDRGGVRLAVEHLAAAPPTSGSGEEGGPTGPVLRLRITDSGIGIRPQDLDKLFQPFRQLDSGLTRQHEGTGLGLAICRRLASLLGGTISAASEPGKGSEFTLLLPANED